MHPRQVISLKPHPFSTSLDESLSFSASSDGTRLISGVTRVHDTREWRGVVAVALGEPWVGPRTQSQRGPFRTAGPCRVFAE